MIRSEFEYKETVKRVQEEEKRLGECEASLKGYGLGNEEIDRAMQPMRSFLQQMKEELAQYEHLKRGDLSAFTDLHQIGHLLIGARIATKTSGRDLAQKLGVHETQVSRDEKNDYHGITIDRVWKILDALNVEVKIGARIKGLASSILNQPRAAAAESDVQVDQAIANKTTMNVTFVSRLPCATEAKNHPTFTTNSADLSPKPPGGQPAGSLAA